MIKVGVLLDCLLLPFTEAVETAAVLGAEGVQFYAVYEGAAPWTIPEQDQRQLKQIIRSSGLELSALCGELGGHGFERPQENREKIEKTKQIMDMAALLETSVVTGHIGVVPDPEALYGAFAEGTSDRLPVSDYIEEKPLGKGDVDVSSYLQALKSIGYCGHLVVERESGTDRIGEIGAGVSLLREKLEVVI